MRGIHKKIMRRIRLVVLIVMFLLLVSGIAMGNDQAVPGNDVVVAKGGSVVIHNREVEAAIDSYIPQGGVSREKRGEYRPRALAVLIGKELFRQEAQKITRNDPVRRDQKKLMSELEAKRSSELIITFETFLKERIPVEIF